MAHDQDFVTICQYACNCRIFFIANTNYIVTDVFESVQMIFKIIAFVLLINWLYDPDVINWACVA
jgi:hypothetical protein